MSMDNYPYQRAKFVNVFIEFVTRIDLSIYRMYYCTVKYSMMSYDPLV